MEAGLTTMRRPSWRSNSLKTLQAMHHAKLLDKGGEVRDAFYAAYWEEDLDIGSVEVIRQVVEDAGLAWEPLEDALEDSLYLDDVMREYQEGIDLGFTGIPAFVIGDVKFTGAQPMALFQKVAQRAADMLERDPEAFKDVRLL